MRAPQDAARANRRRRLSKRGRILVAAVLVALAILFFSLRGIARVYTDYLWFDSLGKRSVFTAMKKKTKFISYSRVKLFLTSATSENFYLKVRL